MWFIVKNKKPFKTFRYLNIWKSPFFKRLKWFSPLTNSTEVVRPRTFVQNFVTIDPSIWSLLWSHTEQTHSQHPTFCSLSVRKRISLAHPKSLLTTLQTWTYDVHGNMLHFSVQASPVYRTSDWLTGEYTFKTFPLQILRMKTVMYVPLMKRWESYKNPAYNEEALKFPNTTRTTHGLVR